jgi:DNA-binding transcriptional LysR family regulator
MQKIMDRTTCMLSFVKVVECLGFSPAARRLTISTSAVTGHVKSLEEKLGVRLLARNTRTVRPTEFGQAYYERCVKILAELEDAEQFAAELRSDPRGVLRLNFAPPMPEIIAPVIAEFAAAHPNLAVQVTVTSKMIDLIDQGIDLALRETPGSKSSYIVRRLATYPMVVCGAPSYFATHGHPECPADLERHNCIVFSESEGNREWRFMGPNGENVVPVSGNLQANDSTALRAAAVFGQGVINVPLFVVAEEFESGRLVATLTDFTSELGLDAIYPDRRHLCPKVRNFIDLAATRLRHSNGNGPERLIALKQNGLDRSSNRISPTHHSAPPDSPIPAGIFVPPVGVPISQS